jgi:DNA invertase Pin-like site-specific DNA recombinase
MLTLLAGVAKFERALMLGHQAAGIRAAKEAGRYKGRAPTAQRKAADLRRQKAEGAKVGAIVAATGINRARVYRILDDAHV